MKLCFVTVIIVGKEGTTKVKIYVVTCCEQLFVFRIMDWLTPLQEIFDT